jgi:hypothetical protein
MNVIKCEFNSNAEFLKIRNSNTVVFQVSFNLAAVFLLFLMLFTSPVMHLRDQSWDPIIPRPTSVTMNNRHGHGILGLCINMVLEYHITRGGAITDLTVTKETADDILSANCLVSQAEEMEI